MSTSRWLKACVAVCAALLTGLAVPASAEPRASVRASVLMPAAPSLAGFEAARCAWLAGKDSSQGVLGYMISLRPGAYDHRAFSLTAINDALVERYGTVGATGPAFDVAFYDSTMGPCGDVLAPIRTYFATGRAIVGSIPFGARYAMVVRSGPIVNVPMCYTLPPVCFGRLPSVTARASDEPGPEPFVFTIH